MSYRGWLLDELYRISFVHLGNWEPNFPPFRLYYAIISVRMSSHDDIPTSMIATLVSQAQKPTLLASSGTLAAMLICNSGLVLLSTATSQVLGLLL